MSRKDLIEDIFDHSSSGDGSREARGLVDIRDALSSMRAIPECELSTERLRTAVLNGAAAPARQSMWRWAVPAGACASVAIALAVANRGADTGRVDRTSSPAPIIAMDVPSSSNPTPSDVLKAVEPLGQPEPSRAVVSQEAREPSRRRVRRARSGAAASRVARKVETVPAASPSTSEAPAAATSIVAPAEPVREPGPTVVVVAERPSATTGAPSAREVSRAEDVVFGG